MSCEVCCYGVYKNCPCCSPIAWPDSDLIEEIYHAVKDEGERDGWNHFDEYADGIYEHASRFESYDEVQSVIQEVMALFAERLPIWNTPEFNRTEIVQ